MYLVKKGGLIVVLVLLLAIGILGFLSIKNGPILTGAAVGLSELAIPEEVNLSENVTSGFVPELITETPSIVIETVPDAPTVGAQTSCGDTIVSDLTLSGDLGPCNPDGLYVGASDIVVNCAGNNIVGTSQPGSFGVYVDGFDNVTIQNCNIINFTNGITYTNSKNGTILDSFVRGSSYGIIVAGTSDKVFINHTTIIESTTYGINLNQISNVSIINSNISASSLYDINVEGKVGTVDNHTIFNNTIEGKILLDGNADGIYVYNNRFWNVTSLNNNNPDNLWNISLDCTKTNILGGRCQGGNFYSNDTDRDIDDDSIINTNFLVPGTGGIYDFLPLSLVYPYYAPGNTSYFVINSTFNLTNPLIDGSLHSARQNISFYNSTTRFTVLDAYFNITVNLTNFAIQANESAIAINLTGATGLASGHTFYLANLNYNNGVVICPNANSLTELNSSCTNHFSFTYDDIANGNYVQGGKVSVDGTDYKIENISGTGALLDTNASLTIWDSNDAGYPYGNQHNLTDEKIYFYANYSNSGGKNISDATCIISYHDGTSYNMTFNTTKLLYQFNRTYPGPQLGFFDWNVTCNKTRYDTLTALDQANLSLSCGQTIDRSFTLGSDLTGCNGTGLSISMANIALNCGYHNITGNGTDRGISLTIHRDNITITNCLISNFSEGVYIFPSSSYIDNSLFTNNTFFNISTSGINAYYLNNCTLSNNHFENISSGMYLTTSTNNYIVNNTFYNMTAASGYGIKLTSSSTNNRIVGNNISRGYHGIYLSFSNNNNITNNYITLNTNGIYHYNSDYEYVLDNTLTNCSESGITMYTSSSNVMVNNTINTTEKGISFMIGYGGHYNNISGSVIDNSTYGVYLATGTNNQLQNNQFFRGEYGVYGNSQSNTLENNSFYNNTNGVYLTTEGSNNQVRGNNFTFGGYGIYLLSANNITNNRVNNNTYGIYFLLGNSTVIGGSINYSTTKDVYVGISGTDTLINLTFNKSKIQAESNGILKVKWYVNVKVNNSLGENILGVNVSAYDKNNNLEQSQITNSQGEVVLGLTDLTLNITNTVYSSNYTINATFNGELLNSTSLNVSQTGSTSIVLPTNLSISTCGYVNRDVTLLSDLASNDTCLIVNASNLVIDGNNGVILGNSSGEGINLTGVQNITIKNLIIVNFSSAIYLENSSNNTLTNNRLENNSFGVKILSSSNYNNLTLNYLKYNLNNGTLVLDSYNNTIYNNYFFNNTNHAYDNGSNYWNGSYSCSGSLNIISQNCSGGNYWSNYSGEDSNFDGIGDSAQLILGDSNQDFLPLMIIPTISCGNVNSSLSIPSGSVLHSMGGADTCFTIINDNIVINGNGASVISSNLYSGDYGVYSQNHQNITIKNLNIYNFSTGIYIQGTGFYLSENNTIVNNTLSANRGIDLVRVHSSNISDNTINCLFGGLFCGNKGIYIYSSSNNNLSRNQIYNMEEGLFFDLTSTGNRFWDFFINSTSNKQVDADFSPYGPSYIYFTNVSFNQTNVTVGPNNYLYVKWYVDVNVTNTSGSPVSGASITAYDSTGVLDDTTITGGNGIGRLSLTEYYLENSVYYYLTNNHTINVEAGGFTKNSTLLNLINTTGASVNITLSNVVCGMNLTTSATLGNNLSCNQPFIVTSDNIVINGNNYTLTGNGSGTAINLNGRTGVNLTNIQISNFSSGIALDYSNNSLLENVVITNSTYGVIFNHSNNNTLSDSILSNNTWSIFAINDENTINNLINVSVNISEINVSGTATVFIRRYLTANITFNNDNLPLPGAVVTGYFNNTGEEDRTGTTGNDGLVVLELAEVKKNVSGTYYLTPHNISVAYISTDETLTNSTSINLTQTGNTQVNLHLNISCSVPVGGMTLTNSIIFCPGTYTISSQISIGANNINLSCLNTTIQDSDAGTGLYNNGYDYLTVSRCNFKDFHKGFEFRNYAENYTLINSSANSCLYGISLDHSNNGQINDSVFSSDIYGIYSYLSDSLVLNRNTFSVSSGSGNERGIYLSQSNNWSISANTINGQYVGVDIVNSVNHTLNNNSLTNSYVALSIDSSSSNILTYYNTFTSSTLRHVTDNSNNKFNTSVNVSGNFSAQGNQYDDYCDKGTDSNNDTYADGPTTNVSNDYPYNSTTSTKFSGSGADYGPKIHDCVTVVQLGSSSGGGGSSTTTTTTTTAAIAETPQTAVTRSPTKPPITTETYNAEETKKYIQTQMVSQRVNNLNTQVKVTLENTGTKKMLLFPGLEQDTDDPYFIVTRKTLGTEGSLFERISSLAYSDNSIAGRLLKAEITNPEQILLNPGEKVEKTLEIKEGLIPHQIKIQFTTFGETVYEQEVKIERKAVSGTAVDVDTANSLVDVYAVIVPEEASRKIEAQAQNGGITGAAVIDLTTNGEDYLLELSIAKKGSSGALFGDIYGPYIIREGKTFVFAQQLKYDPEKYKGENVIRTKIYHGGNVVASNEFPINLG
ncbi:MAG: NosD domain-containing protein [Candidatus Woesearchaeota archaeon]